jgi:hypothetical protein
MLPVTPLLLVNLALDPSGNFLPFEAPGPSYLETRNFPLGGQPIGGLLVDLEKLRHLTDGENFVSHAPPGIAPSEL